MLTNAHCGDLLILLFLLCTQFEHCWLERCATHLNCNEGQIIMIYAVIGTSKCNVILISTMELISNAKHLTIYSNSSWRNWQRINLCAYRKLNKRITTKNLLSEVWFSHNLHRKHWTSYLDKKFPEVLIVVCRPPLPPHTVNLLRYVHYGLI